MYNFARPASFVFILATHAPLAAHEVETLPAVIRVTGEGEASAAPDMATINTGVVTQADSAKAALDQNNAVMQKVLATLKQQGIAAKDVQTSSFNVSPVYRQPSRQTDDGATTPEVVAYRVQNEVRVRVRNLASLGEVLDSLVQAGSNQIHGVSFGIGDPAGVLNEARSKAIRDAKNRAEVYAQAAGVAVGLVRQISEQPVDPPRPMYAGAEARAFAASVPVATGEQEFRVTAHVVYELQSAE
jgi:uncharacterized protein YggE